MSWVTREQTIASRRGTPWYQLDTLARSRDVKTRLRVAKNPSAEDAALWVLARDADLDVREQVARRDDVPVRVLALLSSDVSARVRSAVARNPGTSATTLRGMSEDPHHGVRFAVQAAQRLRERSAAEVEAAVEEAREVGQEPDEQRTPAAGAARVPSVA